MVQSLFNVIRRESGMIHIYLKPGDKRKRPGVLGFFAARPLYLELVDAGIRDGLLNAQAHHSHYGYNNHGKIRAQDPELGNAELTICVELIGEKSRLDAFCRAYGDLLNDKVVIYKGIEQWDIQSHTADAPDAAPVSQSEMESAIVA